VQDRRFEGVLIVFLDGDKLAWLLRLSPAAREALRVILSLAKFNLTEPDED
jgi:hypothetical protein